MTVTRRRDTYVLMLSLFPSLIIGNVVGLKTGEPFMMVLATCFVLLILYNILDRVYPQ